MSGWIKLDKKLTDSIRFRRVVRKVRESNALRRVTEDDVAVSDDFYVTLVLGSLLRLWVYADTHIDNDNTLDMTLDEIDELVGVDGFGQSLPADWLQVLDSNRVQLPDFLAHNGSSEKQRRDNARRQAEYRARRDSHNVTRDVTLSNARNDARPDQTREDKTNKEKEQSARANARPATRLPNDFQLTPERRLVAEAERLPAERTFAKFVDYWSSASGAKARKLDWDATWRNWCRTEADRNGASNGARKQASEPRVSALERVRLANAAALSADPDREASGEGLVGNG